MSHFGRTGPPDIKDTYSLLVLNITFRTSADDLFPLFDKYGKVVDVFIPRDRRTGDSRGFAFVRYKYQDEAAKAVEKLDGRVVDGREIMVQFAKYGPNAEKMHRDDYRDRDYRRRSRSRSRGKDDWDRRGRERDRRPRSRSRGRSQSRSRSLSHSSSPSYRRDTAKDKHDDGRRPRQPYRSASPRRSPSPQKGPSPRRSSVSRGESPYNNNHKERSSTPKSISPRGRHANSRSLSPRSDADE